MTQSSKNQHTLPRWAEAIFMLSETSTSIVRSQIRPDRSDRFYHYQAADKQSTAARSARESYSYAVAVIDRPGQYGQIDV